MCRRRCTNPLDRCLECEREYLDWLEDRHEFERICESDPQLDPTWKPATEEEYRAWVETWTLPAMPVQGVA